MKKTNQRYYIDFVITWVNSADKTWMSKRNGFISKEKADDNQDARYRDWELLKYWFRGVEQFAPWVNKIYLVTDKQTPDWLNAQHPKLRIVDHTEIIDHKYLPVFNSNAIEMNLWKIKGLSEYFVYFNDDTIITKTLKPTDFFKNGLPCDAAIVAPAIQPQAIGIGTTILNNMGIINSEFNKNKQMRSTFSKWFNLRYGMDNVKNLLLLPWGKFSSFQEFHLPNSFLKTNCKYIYTKYHPYIENTLDSRFRNYQTNVNQWVFRDYQIASGNFFPRNVKKFGKMFVLSDDIEKAISAILKTSYKTICLNDDHVVNSEFHTIKKQLNEALDLVLPNKSQYEI